MSEDAKAVMASAIVFSMLMAALWFGVGSFVAANTDIATWPAEGRAAIVIFWFASSAAASYAAYRDICP